MSQLSIKKSANPGFSCSKVSLVPVVIKWDNPITEGLKAAFISTEYGWFDVVNQVLHTSNDGTLRFTDDGLANNFNGAGNVARFPHLPGYALSSGNGMSIFADLDLDSKINYSAIASCHDTNTTNGWEFRLGTTATATRMNFLRATATGYSYEQSVLDDIVQPGRNRVCVSAPSNEIDSRVNFFVNGEHFTSVDGGGTGTGTMGTSSADLYIGGREDLITGIDGAMNVIYLWDRDIHGPEVQEVSNRPSVIFKPASQKNYYYGIGPVGQTIQISPAIENNTVENLIVPVTKTVTPANENNFSQPVAPNKILSITQATENSTVKTVTAQKSASIIAVSEINTAQSVAIGASIAVSPALENNTAISINSYKSLSISSALEIDSSKPVTLLGSTVVNPAIENNTVKTIDIFKQASIAAASEINTAGLINSAKIKSIGPAIENNTIQSIDNYKNAGINPAIENNYAMALFIPGDYTVSPAVEINSTFVILVNPGLIKNVDINFTFSRRELRFRPHE